MHLIGILNFLVGIYLVIDTQLRLKAGTQILYFDGYFMGFAKYIPLTLGIFMVLAAIGIFIFRRSSFVLLGFMMSFIFIIFFTPTALFMSTDREEIQFLLLLELSMLIISIVILYTNQNSGRFRKKVVPRFTYEDYKRSMNRISSMSEEESKDFLKKGF